VSVEVGNVSVPVFEIDEITGVVKVLFVNVCVVVSNAIEDVSDKSVEAIVIAALPLND